MKTLHNAVNEFLLAKRADGCTKKTVSWYLDILRIMVKSFGSNKPLSEINANDMRMYIVKIRTNTKLSYSSIASYINALHGFWSWCCVEYNITDNPMQNIKRPKKKKMKPKSISSEDFVKLFNATAGNDTMSIRDRTIFCLFADTGLRLSGLVGLTVYDVDQVNKRAKVTEKGGKSRTIFWTGYTNWMLKQWLDHRPEVNSAALFVSLRYNRASKPLTLSGVQQIMRRYKLRLGITGPVNPHAFRHRFAIEYLKNGGDVITLATLGGWSDLKTIQDYYAIFDENELAMMHESNSPLNSLLSDVEKWTG